MIQLYRLLANKIFLFLLLGMFTVSCSVNKYIPDGEYLLNDNIYEVEKDSLTDAQ